MALAQLFHQLKAVPIRQAEIAQHNIETVLAGDLERGLDAVSDINGVTAAGEEANHGGGSGLMVFTTRMRSLSANFHQQLAGGGVGSAGHDPVISPVARLAQVQQPLVSMP